MTMTEKRFTTDNGSNEDVTLVDNVTGKEYESNFDEVVELLNELSTENRQLKKQIESEHQMLDNAILLERTRMGQSALKQYREAIQ
jgi:hypothetical protein